MERKNEKVEALLMRKAEQVRSAAEILLEKTTDWQVIKEFMSNRHSEIVLSTQQEKKLERLKFIYDQQSSGRYTKAQIIAQLTNEKLYNVSLSQAYEDIRNSAELFTSVVHFKKQFELNNEIEICKAARAKALELLDFKSVAALSRNIKDLIALQPDEEDSSAEMFEGHKMEAVFDPALLGAPTVINMKEVLDAINKKRAVKINIDMFEELKPAEDGN